MSGRRVATLVVAIAACVALPRTAQAQIYSWRDARGTLVLSNQKPSSAVEVRTYSVPQADSVRTTRYVAPARTDHFEALLADAAEANRIRPDLVRAVVQVESGFNPAARSPKGALGLMQLMPATIRDFGVRNPFDPDENVRAGTAYLRQLLDRYDNDETLALAAYNAGPGAVDRHAQSIPPFPETQQYVARVTGISGKQRPDDSVAATVIYRYTELVGGRAVTRYSDRKPADGPYETVRSR